MCSQLIIELQRIIIKVHIDNEPDHKTGSRIKKQSLYLTGRSNFEDIIITSSSLPFILASKTLTIQWFQMEMF